MSINMIIKGADALKATANVNHSLRMEAAPLARGDAEAYEGEYVVVPDDNPQIIECAGKIMREDVSIAAVPFLAIDNFSGGKTVTIG